MSTAGTPARRLVSELVIGLAACAGLYMMLVDPVDHELAQVRVAPVSAAMAGATSGVDPIMARKTLSDAGAFARRFIARASASANEASLFSAVVVEAERAGVRLDSMQPGTARARSARPRPPADVAPGSPPPPPPPDDRVRAYTMNVTGTYDALCRFIAGVQAAEGFTIVRAGSVQPIYSPGSRDVQATIHTEHVAMDTAALAAFARAGAPTETPK